MTGLQFGVALQLRGSMVLFCASQDLTTYPRSGKAWVCRSGAKDRIETSSIKITLSGAPGDDAKHYQERDLKRAIQKVQS
jgi:hypothetical protein